MNDPHLLSTSRSFRLPECASQCGIAREALGLYILRYSVHTAQIAWRLAIGLLRPCSDARPAYTRRGFTAAKTWSKVGGSRKRTSRVCESRHILGKDASCSHSTNQFGTPDATSLARLDPDGKWNGSPDDEAACRRATDFALFLLEGRREAADAR